MRGWQAGLEELLGRIGGRFGRVEPRRRARAFVCRLLADLPRKNCWTIAEHAGDANPDGMQHLLGRAVWDHEGVRDDVRALDAGVPAAWVTGDEVYGADSRCGPSLRSAVSAMCWRWPATTGWSPPRPAPTPAKTDDRPTNHEAHDHGWSTRLGR